MRGTRAIQNTVDEVFKFSRQQNEMGCFNVLTLEKTRSRAPGSYKFTYDDESWGWKFGGRLEDDIVGGNQASTSNMARCLHFLRYHKGTPYEAEEIAVALDLNKDSVRRDLRRASSEGLVNCGRNSQNRRALVYYLGARREMLSNITTDQREIMRGVTLDQIKTGEAEPKNQGLTPQLLSNITTDQLINVKIGLNIVKPDQQVDQLITSVVNLPESVTTQEENHLINGKTPQALISTNVETSPPYSSLPDTEDNEGKSSDYPETKSQKLTRNTTQSTDTRLGFITPTVRIKFASALGEVRAIATPSGNGKYDFQITYPGVEEDDTITVDCIDDEKATKMLKRRVGDWRKKLRFSVMQLPKDDSLQYVWIENCKCVDFPAKHRHQSLWVFDTPDGDRIHVGGAEEFRLES